MFKKFLTGVMALLIAATVSTTAMALDRRVVIVNDSPNALVGFSASNVSDNYWSGDILGQNVIMPGESVVVNFDDRSGYCRFDFKATFYDGYKSWETMSFKVNVCKVGTYTYY